VRARLAALTALTALLGAVAAYGVAAPADLNSAAAAVAVSSTAPGCAAPLVHPTGQHAWFDVATVDSQLARNWESVICSAADGSTINLAIWFIGLNGSDTLRLIADLKRMHDRHDVHVNIIVGKSEYEPGPAYISGLSFPALTAALSFAHLMSCFYGCRSPLKTAILHSKFMTVSRTRDGFPAVLESSANWDAEQWEQTRQSGIYFGNDRQIYRAFEQRFRSLAACAKGSCRDDKDDPVRNSHRVWYDKDGLIWRGASHGAAVYFDPLPPTDDPVTTVLKSLRCHGSGSIDVMTLWLTRAKLIRQLRRLRREGCTLRILVEHPRGTPSQATNLGERCVGLSHDKLIAVNTGKRKLVIQGSEDWTTQSGWTHDQQVVQVSRPAVYRAYHAYYKRAAAGSVLCQRPPGSPPIRWLATQTLTQANET
jgi:hypothetical protein